MAEDAGGQEKTEEPSARRRSEAKQKGNVAKSAEINSAFIILIATFFLYLSGGMILSKITLFLREYLLQAPTIELQENMVRSLFMAAASKIFSVLAPFLVTIVIVGVLANVLQFGFIISGEALTPKFEKLNIIEGFKKFFALRSLVELVKGIVKIAIIGSIIYFTLAAKIDTFYRMMDETVGHILIFLAQTSGEIMLKVALAMVILALLDYAYQKYEHEKNLKMTKEEVKEESKMLEGNPQIKARIREIQRSAARRRMMAAIPEADVVITNPTHYAVALKYDPAEHAAPHLIAKGERKIALRIKELAYEHNIPVVENPPLARLLVKHGEVGKEIPMEAYQAVAEILSYVYRLQNRTLNLN